MKKICMKIEGFHCVSCALSVDMELEELEGVKKVDTSYAKAECNVEYDEKKVSEAKIKEVIAKLGYSARVK